MKYFVILTGQLAQPGRAELCTTTLVATPGPEVTRSELYKWALDKLPERFRDANTLFFSAEPEALTGSRVSVPATATGASG